MRHKSAFLLLVSFVGIGAFIILTTKYSRLVPSVIDDGYYYLSIARNFWEYHRLTYDGYSHSYGFQPLWQLVVILLGWLPVTTGQFLRLVMLLALAFFSGAGLLIYLFVRRSLTEETALFTTALWIYNLALLKDFVINMKENVLLAVLMLASGLVLFLPDCSPRKRSLWIGALAGLIFLTRPNALPLALLLLSYLSPLAGGRRMGITWRLWAAGAAIACGLSATWTVYACAVYGTVMPTSGLVKLYNARFHLETVDRVAFLSSAHFVIAVKRMARAYVELWGRWLAPLAEIVLVPSLLLSFPQMCRAVKKGWRAFPIPAGFLTWMGLLAAYAFINTFANSLMLKDVAYATWYFIPEAVIPILVCGVIYHFLSAQPRAWRPYCEQAMVGASFISVQAWRSIHGSTEWGWLSIVFAVFLLLRALPPLGHENLLSRMTLWGSISVVIAIQLVSIPYERPGSEVFFDRNPSDYSLLMFQTGLFLRDAMPHYTAIAASDCGILGYFSGLPVVNLEGLMESREYFETYLFNRRGLAAYFQRARVRYLFGTSYVPRPDARPLHEHLRDSPFSYVPAWEPFPYVSFADDSEIPVRYLLYRPTWNVDAVPARFCEFGAVYVDGSFISLPRYMHADGSIDMALRPDVISLNFEDGSYRGWLVEGRAFEEAPAPVTRFPAVKPAEGKFFVTSDGAGGHGSTGRLTSVPFRLEKTFLRVRVGGTGDAACYTFRILSGDEPLITLTGENSDVLMECCVDLSEHRGKLVRMEIEDRGELGYIMVDDIRFLSIIP